MSDYINKSAAMSVCNTQRAYSTMQIIRDLPCAKVVDREQFDEACKAVYDESKMWRRAPMGEISDYMWWAAEVGEILFGGAK